MCGDKELPSSDYSSDEDVESMDTVAMRERDEKTRRIANNIVAVYAMLAIVIMIVFIIYFFYVNSNKKTTKTDFPEIDMY